MKVNVDPCSIKTNSVWIAGSSALTLGCEISQPELVIATKPRSDTLNSCVDSINSDQPGKNKILIVVPPFMRRLLR